MIRDPFDGMSGDELDPQAAESAQLTALGMHAVSDDEDEEEEDDSDEEGGGLEADDDDDDEKEEAADPSDDLNKDGLAELEEMEQRLREEEPVLDFAIVEDE